VTDDAHRYTVTRRADRAQRLHLEHPWEVCNTDADDEKRLVDQVEAIRLLEAGDVTVCQHCKPDPYG